MLKILVIRKRVKIRWFYWRAESYFGYREVGMFFNEIRVG